MKIKDLLTYTNEMAPNVLPESLLLAWINELEGRIMLDIYLMAPEEVKSYSLPENEETELLVPIPHTAMYRHWMKAMVALENGEYSKYQNQMEVFNNAWNEYACWFAETQGTEGDGVKFGFYLSAYGIAVKHGYGGSEEEWLESLKGEPGKAFTYDDFTEEQLQTLKDGVVQDALDEASASAEAAAESARAAEEKASAITGMTAQAETLMPGAAATARAEMVNGVYKLTLGIPAGEAGKDGATGPAGSDGYSPTVSVTIIAGGHRVSITDANGTKTFDVMNGEDGAGGGGGGENGATFYPYVDSAGNLSWTNDGGLQNPQTVNIKGPAGQDGKDGQQGPAGQDGKDGSTGPAGADGQPGADGKDAKINGVNVLTIEVDENLTITQNGSVLKIGLGKVPENSQSTVVALLTGNWAEENGKYSQTVNVPFMTADAKVVSVDVQKTGTDDDADAEAEAGWVLVSGSTDPVQLDGAMKFFAYEIPEVNIPVKVGVA